MRGLFAWLRAIVLVPQHQARIQLICAATTLTPAWHGQILQIYLTQHLPVSASYGLVTVGGAGLREGCLALVKYAPVVLPKVLRVLGICSIEETNGFNQVIYILSLVLQPPSLSKSAKKARKKSANQDVMTASK
ncbi:hypothetical protein DYB36_003914 [Aphanomyces astaci]|uniref:Secreted protein n=1 Tax=Aphanomyces astaci TaxID=112090 RepID=A0A397ABC6_APHAT|nr:hypothetical protein DYB36_003914 [Aphanomyces astaci]